MCMKYDIYLELRLLTIKTLLTQLYVFEDPY